MRFQPAMDNGNVTLDKQDPGSLRNINNKNWISSINTNPTSLYENRAENLPFNSNYSGNYNANENSEGFVNYMTGNDTGQFKDQLNVEIDTVVCNRQYRLNNTSRSIVRSNNTNLDGATETGRVSRETFLDGTDVQKYSDTSPIDEERALELSDTDEMSEKVIQAVPRGIVNPNYPGFQHLAHTLQDYSSNGDNFYQSENDMTDDDIDVENTELAYENEPNKNETLDITNINNNNNNCHTPASNLPSPQKDLVTANIISASHDQHEIPDLLKTVTKNNNCVDSYDTNCTDTDIENNFNAKEIIGDFNKEIEDEIKLLLNYNINIQDDLEELRRDINDSLAKPIETTINNISDVVNHVIKKLVETQCESSEDTSTTTLASDEKNINDHYDINKENETNTRMEKNLCRPTFLFLDTNTRDKIRDAFLSDGKDEININDYDPEKLSTNVENTIKQLSTELRKIIPKLDEMRERDRMWAECKDTVRITTDANSNEIAKSSSNLHFMNTINSQEKDKADVARNHFNETLNVKNKHLKSRIEPRAARDRPKEQPKSNTYVYNAQSKTSVRKDDNVKEYDDLDNFDVYNIETALPKLDWDAIENHLKAAKEAERRKRNDREEIRRQLAMDAEAEEYYSMGHTDRPGKKPSLHSRLQSGMNLQICFMNETASDNETTSDLERNLNHNTKNLSQSSIFSQSNNYNHPYQTRPLSVNITKHDKISTVQSGTTKLRPSSLTLKNTKSRSSQSLTQIELKESDFYALQATLQTEARIALAQAKEMARIQMERSWRGRASPVSEMVRRSVAKAGAPLPADRRRVSRQLLTDMNIAQLQVIVNEMHSQIESLNDTLVKLLMARDELHMGQDSMLVDIEDLTRYLGVKEQTKKTKGAGKTGMKRLTSLVNK